jgi:predicted RNA-binding protein YlxR (DUF448 family)
VVRSQELRVEADPTGKRAGRGAYLCAAFDCWKTALRRGALERALKTSLSAEDRAALEAFARGLPAAEGEQDESKTV